MGVTRDLAAYCAGLSTETLPADVRHRIPLLVLDLLGSIVRARAEAAATPSLLAAVEALGLGHGSARVFGDDTHYGPAGAAFLNAALGHALDFDDTHAAGTLHPGAPVIPAAIAAGEMSGASGAEVLAGIVAGYETACRIALALPAGDHYARGFHPSATCGVFGAAAAAARVLRLNADGIESALGIALSQSAGSLQFLVNGAWTKTFQVGWAAMSGLAAASLAKAGFRGAAEAIEGRHGFLQAYAPDPDPARVTRDLGSVFETMATGVKPWPSCRYGHAGIEAVLALRAEHDLSPDEVREVTYGLSHAGMLLIGAPVARRQDPRNLVEAQFSGPFVLAVALVTGEMTWDGYDLLHDPAIRRLMPRIACAYDPEIQAEFPANMSGRITITAGGKTFTRKIVVPLGEPSRFLDADALQTKFQALAGPILGQGCETLIDAALRLAELEDIRELTAADAVLEMDHG
jgi:2-methylcitrate dehydratase PrpD